MNVADNIRLNIAILGSGSFISRNFVQYLRNEKLMDKVSLDLYGIEETGDPELAYTRIDLCDKEKAEGIDYSKYDIIYLFAGMTGSEDCFDRYDSFIDANERVCLNVLNGYRKMLSEAGESAKEAGSERRKKPKLVFPSTRLVYRGMPGKLREDSEKEAKTIYAANKIACEHYLEMYHNAFGIDYCILRICIPYASLITGAPSYGTAGFMLGRAQKGQDITLYGDGSQRRTLTHMEDLCRLLYESGINDGCINDAYNIGGDDYSLAEMAGLIAPLYGVSVTNIPWPELSAKVESGDTVFDSEKLDTVLHNKGYRAFEDWILEQKKG